MFCGRKYEDVKASFQSAEQIEKGEQEAISLQLYANRITGESEGIIVELKGFRIRWKVAVGPGKQAGHGRVFK